MKRRRAPSTCPVCGADVSPNAKACSECGACDKSGWRDDADANGLDLPEEDFDYDGFVAEEFGGSAKPASVPWFWWVVAVLLLLGFVLLTVLRWPL